MSRAASLPRCSSFNGSLSLYACPPTHPQDARRAFKSLAYKRYQHVPLYLEWAPKGIFSSPPPPRSAPAAAAKAGPAAAPAAAAGKNGATAAAAPAAAAAAGKSGKASKAKAGAAAAPEAELLTGLAEAQAEEAESSSIFVKNLAWGTEEAALRKHFDAAVSSAGAWMGGRCWGYGWVGSSCHGRCAPIRNRPHLFCMACIMGGLVLGRLLAKLAAAIPSCWSHRRAPSPTAHPTSLQVAPCVRSRLPRRRGRTASSCRQALALWSAPAKRRQRWVCRCAVQRLWGL